MLGVYQWTQKLFRGLLWSLWPLTTAGQLQTLLSQSPFWLNRHESYTKLYRIFVTNEEHYRKIVSISPFLDSIQTSHVFSRKTRVQKGRFSKDAVGSLERLGESGATHDSQSASRSGVEAWVARNLNGWDDSDAGLSEGWVRCPSGLASLHHSRLSTRSSYQLYSFSGDRRFCHDNHGSFVYDSPNLFCGPSGSVRTGLTWVRSEPGHRTHLTSLLFAFSAKSNHRLLLEWICAWLMVYPRHSKLTVLIKSWSSSCDFGVHGSACESQPPRSNGGFDKRKSFLFLKWLWYSFAVRLVFPCDGRAWLPNRAGLAKVLLQVPSSSWPCLSLWWTWVSTMRTSTL